MTNQELIAQYYRRHRDELLCFVSSRLGGDISLAEDMVQDMFLRLLADADRRPLSEVTLPALVMTMARHLITDHYRHLAHQRAYTAHAQAVMPSDCHPEPAIYTNDLLRHIERGLSRLPQATARIYRLHLYDGLAVSDIARQLQLNYKAVEYRLGQARRHVRRLLENRPLVAQS